MLDPDAPLPLYHQLAELLAAAVRDGEYSAGDKLPSENALAREFGLGRPTVRQATDVLVRRGLLERRRGAGTFVRGQRPRVDLFSLTGTQSSMRADGGDVETGLLGAPTLARISAAGQYNPFSGGQAVVVTRLSRMQRVPVLLEHIYLCPETFGSLLDMDLEGKSLSSLVEEEFQLRPTSAEQQFSVVPVRGRAARALSVAPGTDLLFVQRKVNFRAKPGAVYVELRCRTDRMSFVQTIQGAEHG